MTSSYLKHLIRKPTRAQHWNGLEKTFNDDSQGRLMELRWQLQILRK